MTTLSASSCSRSDSSVSQQRPSGSVMHAATTPPSVFHRTTTTTTAAPPATRGVRRRREESIEIEELDSDTMRQSSYNYFQRYARPTSPAYNASGVSSGGNAAFAFLHATGAHALRSGSSRKRQRTLADHLEELCISGADYNGRSRSPARSAAMRSSRGSDSSPDTAMVDSDQSDDARELGTNSSCGDDTCSGVETRSELLVYGGVPSMKGFFFGSARRRPMDRVFRHYAAVASQAASASETNGNELVLFRHRPSTPPPSPYRMSMPFFSLSPQELEALTRQEKNKRVVELHDGDDDTSAPARSLAGPYRRSRSGSGSASSTASSPPFRALGVPRTDIDDLELDDEDMDGSYCFRKPTPHASGEISHSEWFLDEVL